MQISWSNPYKCDFWKVGYPNIFFQEICSSGGKQTIQKVLAAAFIVKNCHSLTSLKDILRHPV